jgi:hypothetical protein
MKKVTLILLISVVFCSCDKELNLVQQKKLFTGTGKNCRHQISLEISQIGDKPGWIAKHSKYYVTPRPNPSTVCGAEMEYIDIIAYLNDKKDYRKEELAGFLHDYGKNICYSITDDEIECVHHVEDQAAIEVLDDINPKDDIDFSIVNAKLVAEGVPDFRIGYYNKYVEMSLNAFNNIDVDILNTYDPEKHCFSLPFLRIILDKYGKDTDTDGIKDELNISFVKASVYGYKKLYISVLDAAGNRQYYNFSQIPNKNPTHHYYYGFSPL